MSFLKSIIAFIFANIIGFGSRDTRVYVAPEVKTEIRNEISTSTPELQVKKEVTVEAKNETGTKPLATSTPVKKVVPIAEIKTPTTPQSKTKESVNTQTTPEQKPVLILPPPDFETINKKAREVIVNILCTTNGNSLSPVSGTGVIVGQSGLILTNAHIAQYLLLKDFGRKDAVECVGRTGSPAYPRYNLELVYISPIWVKNNKSLLKEQNPQGTGENDFAFLRITNNIDNSLLPEGFKYIPMNVVEIINLDDPVLLISYPAGFLGGISILQGLNITSAITTVREVFTFKTDTIDLISVPGTVVSQKGSSGGAVIDKFSTLIGLISTSSDGDTTDKRDLRAITLGYINRTMQEEFGIDLKQFVEINPLEFAKKFQEINAPNLTKIITDELSR